MIVRDARTEIEKINNSIDVLDKYEEGEAKNIDALFIKIIIGLLYRYADLLDNLDVQV